MARISFQHVEKTYDNNVTVVPDLNLDIKDKEFVVLVGPSGCGKSTTLRMIAGLESITSGELYIGDRVVNELQPKDRDIAMVFQTYALYPHMTVYKNMAYALQLKKTPKDEIDRKVKHAAEILGLTEYLNRKPRALSGGQRQRVALGRAMVRNPEVFLLDEPLSNLDAKLRTEMRAQIAKLHKQLDTTFVYVTHDQTEAMTMADRIVVMNKGVIQQFDTPAHIYDHPANLFVATFIGSPIKNEDLHFAIPAGKVNATFDQYVGKTVTLGIRPEDLHVEKIMVDTYPDAVFGATLDLVENTGSEMNLYFNYHGKDMILKTPSRFDYRDGDHISMAIDKNKIHLFDKETEKAIS
ncbi:ABC transporter ATP-binding protein [Sharpea azabuensis]|uniref:ABC transporter ATP-binding protein n=1 Tax=Sharpea azabuensis TaxID=322505 RepID=UPI00156A6B99|nr:sn-glycerol-3-phosphate ABC transporter ATP-binding protein UgpC [Sharpea azabuensis]